MDGNEISESAKAVQEVAKTSNTALQIVKDTGGFISRIIGEPAEIVSGMLKDRLLYARWERQQRLTQRAKQFVEEKNIQGELRKVPPKIALPIIENAILEENDELQDLWARLIASSVDPNFEGTLRTAFIDIIKQLEVIDVHILNFIYEKYLTNEKSIASLANEHPNLTAQLRKVREGELAIGMFQIIKKLDLTETVYKESIDNLMRVKCVDSFISNQTVNIPSSKKMPKSIETVIRAAFKGSFIDSGNLIQTDKINFNINHSYDKVCITPLGISFAKACMSVKSKDEKEMC